jgi:predicted nucleic acid-binding protein
MDLSLCQQALEFARQLGQSKVYDAFYLAVAKTYQAELWTGDQHFYQRCRDQKLNWVMKVTR